MLRLKEHTTWHKEINEYNCVTKVINQTQETGITK